MEISVLLNILLLVTLFGCLLAGFPVAFTLAGVALVFALIGTGFGVFDGAFISAIPYRIYGNVMTTEVLVAVPLFVFMGVMLERSKIAAELLITMGALFGRLRGGLGISVFIVGALLAASTGIVGATVVTMGLLSLPTMLKQRYDASLACGSICAAGTLGQIIPPSIVLILLGDQISNAHVDAQRAQGNFAPEPVSVGDLFAGALLPGLLLVALYILYQVVIAWLRPESAPAVRQASFENMPCSRVMAVLLPPVALIIAVLGSILIGVCTPTEAASIGAVGAILLAGLKAGAPGEGNPDLLQCNRRRLRNLPIYLAFIAAAGLLVMRYWVDLRLQRTLTSGFEHSMIVFAMLLCGAFAAGILWALWRLWHYRVLQRVMESTLHISAMVFVILIGATFFALVFRGYGGDELIQELLRDLPGGLFTVMFVVMVVMFLLGFFLDFMEITLVVVPIVAPVLLAFENISPIWLGVMIAINLQTSFLTPPFGFALFYLRGVAPQTMNTSAIYRGVIPFVLLQLCVLGLLAWFPQLATWLPQWIFRFSR